jgi:hypothetical protein
MKTVATALAMLAVIAAAAACLAFPLTSNPGPESAQVLAVVGGLALCISQAVRGAARSPDGYVADVAVGLLWGAVMTMIFVVFTGVAGFVRPSCSASRGFLAFIFSGASSDVRGARR